MYNIYYQTKIFNPMAFKNRESDIFPDSSKPAVDVDTLDKMVTVRSTVLHFICAWYILSDSGTEVVVVVLLFVC